MQILPRKKGLHLLLFGLAYDLPMRPYEVSEGARTKQLLVQVLPT
ncbi:MAG: hypothetical protein JWL77_479 [Chthonomonadaceae bacterium]|nr:hypothetical protein [Chthonomonadaceae bacterium]